TRDRGFVLPKSSSAGIVGWAKALVPHVHKGEPIVRRAHAFFRRSVWVCDAWARRTIGIAAQKGRASAFAHPTVPCMFIESNENRPLFRLWARGRPHSASSVSLAGEGDGAPTKRMAWITPDRSGSA